MQLIDTLYCTNSPPKEAIPCVIQYCKPTAIVNRRDAKGRTALHLAVVFNNKQAAETLLHLGANPHI
jgi:ankyrin repeat protein